MSTKSIPWKKVKKANRIVIKIGTKGLIKEDLSFDQQIFKNLALDVNALYQEGKDIIIVSSGAVNAGVKQLKLPERPRELVELQTMAAIGNPLLINQYQAHFKFCTIGQILITQDDLSARSSYINFRNTIQEMMNRRIIPIINENDVVSVNELEQDGGNLNFTDNDILAGIIAATVEADLLVILSDTDGLYTKHPNSEFAEFISFVPKINQEIRQMAQKGTKFGRGGMISKLDAAQILTHAGGTVLIADAKKTRIKNLMNGKDKCTFFSATDTLKNKEIWLMYGTNISGSLLIDEGAENAIHKDASLLFAGIQDCTGNFSKGDIIALKSMNGSVIARGKTKYSSDALTRFKNMNETDRKEYFKKQNVREIISHKEMVFLDF